ncbi:nucleoside hydrolase [Arcticibacterium luteifluviistationis]|uniref:Nucleoside hydrolase n=1 Tax=Arcticibacterium luteifluviistationis TaxID=1784714 RepID=A0A2Z4G7U9_9BACT|nr:nucleoside hydrolase [Arcticibacterium luteifluviistationis]AWV97148.1 nucleoside hydrolase [Arcticibacterium luteifluviistationis]
MNIYLPILAFLFLSSCNENVTSEVSNIKVILDTDMGSDCDDVGALAMLNEYKNQGKAEIKGVIYSSGVMPYGAGVIDAINRYYGNDKIPIGASYDSLVGDPIDKMQAEKLSKDTAAFKNKIIKNTDAIEQTQLIRSILTNQPDNSIVYITIGHTKGLYDLLVSKPDTISRLSGMELANKKIKKWVALGALKASNQEKRYVKDWNFFSNGTAKYSKFVVENFPKPIYFIDAGSDIMTGKSLANTPNGNIVRTAYRDWLWNVEKKLLEDQRPSWDLMTVYFAVEKPEKHFETIENGYLEFDIEKGCRWNKTDSLTNQYFVLQKQGYQDEISNYLNKMISKRGMEE